MTHLARNSLKFKFLKPPQSVLDDEYSPCTTPNGEAYQAKKKSSNSFSKILTEGDPKKKKTKKLDHIEGLNNMIEETLKKTMYQKGGYHSYDSSLSLRLNQFPLRPQNIRLCDLNRTKTEQGKKKKDSVNAANTKKAKKGQSSGTASPSTHGKRKPERLPKTDGGGSDFSFDKVLGLCRSKLNSMHNRRIELLESIALMDRERERKRASQPQSGQPSPGQRQSINSFNPPNVSILLTDASNKLRQEGDALNRKAPGEAHKRVGKIRSQTQQKAQKTLKISPQQSNKGIGSPKIQINEILKSHAQKISAHSMRSAKVDLKSGDQDVTQTKKPETPSCGEAESEKKYQKVIEIEKRVEKKENNEGNKDLCLEKGEGGKEEQQEDISSKPDGSDVEKDTGKEEKPVPEESTKDTERRVTYTDRLLTDRCKVLSPRDDAKTLGAVVASVVQKLNNPLRTTGNPGGKVDGTGECVSQAAPEARPETAVPAPVTTPSESILLSSMVESITSKQRGVREPRLEKDQIRKPSEHTIRTKCSRSAELKDIVAQVIKDHKIFCIFDNHWYIVRPVREELLSRGWLEVIPDRRLIPRRKPPPAGPTLDRLSSADYAIEAILTAKEAFADDVTDVIMKIPPTKLPVEKSKIQRKYSDESVKETYSEFRIVPPSVEKKKNNADIREFVTKFQSEIQQLVRQNALMKNAKRQDGQNAKDGSQPKEDGKFLSLTKSVQDILDTINENKKLLSRLNLEGADALTKEEKRKESLDFIYRTIVNKGKKEPVADDSGKDSKQVPSSHFSLTENESKIASKIIQSSNARINFMWLSIKPAIHLKCFNYSPETVNKFQKTTFCTKIGLWSHLNNIHWYAHEVNFPAKSPRMYNTGEADDLQAFFQDFQMTACIGILKWLSETFFDKGIKGVQKKKGKVPIKAFEFAIRQCERYIRFRENEDINCLEEPKVMQEEWNTFLQWFYIITNDHGKVQETSNAQIMVVYTKAVEILRAMKRHWPEFDIDGRLNIWIMKPYCASCGRGIFMTNNVYYIGQHSKYIVQKYIEKPLLIYNTKFDIRQWFMITKLVPLEIWMYKECYLRFCTQPFALRNLHESVHLSNNSVQRKYVSQRDPTLPDQNMWDSNTFQHYLKTIGQPNAWNEIIYPGMRDAIISIMLAAQDNFDSQRRNWFEVYGADFMISANLKDGPWLIEINENPAMDPSTKVTARLCPQMLRDVIKVVVDKRANRNALTGQWELVYRQNYSPSFGTIDIDVKGKRISRITQSMRSGYASTPSFLTNCVNSQTRKDSPEKDGKKPYEVVKSYNAKKVKEGEEGNCGKVSLWRARGKAKGTNESNTSCTVKSQVEETLGKVDANAKALKDEAEVVPQKEEEGTDDSVNVQVTAENEEGPNFGHGRSVCDRTNSDDLVADTRSEAA